MSINQYQEVDVECDDCGANKSFDCTPYCHYDGYTIGVDNETLQSAGWVQVGEDTHYCESCKENHRDEIDEEGEDS
jgi:hypothetical protein